VPDWVIDPASDVPPSRQLVSRVLDGLASGVIAAGDKLPSVRGLAALALVNPNTAARAYRDLEHLGVVAGESGRGVFVRPLGPAIAAGIRRDETRIAFEHALDEARRCGHTLEELGAIVSERKRRSA
jgi:GntR family transcriptional regulator